MITARAVLNGPNEAALFQKLAKLERRTETSSQTPASTLHLSPSFGEKFPERLDPVLIRPEASMISLQRARTRGWIGVGSSLIAREARNRSRNRRSRSISRVCWTDSSYSADNSRTSPSPNGEGHFFFSHSLPNADPDWVQPRRARGRIRFHSRLASSHLEIIRGTRSAHSWSNDSNPVTLIC